MNTVEERTLGALGKTPGISLWEALIALYQADREAFYMLACDGVSADAPARLVELAEVAKRVRDAVRGSYQIEGSGRSARLVGPRVEKTFIPANLVEKVRAFLLKVDGKGTREGAGKDYEGESVSEAEARFKVGERATWEADRQDLQRWMNAEPLVLRLDPADLAHLATQPPYVTFGLQECARRTVLAPTQVFRGLNRGEGCQDNLRDGLAFCGKPRRAVDNTGRLIAPPEGMVFAVYADADGVVFDWDWVEENPTEPGYPINRELRFDNPCRLGRDAVLELPNSLPTPQFKWTRACYSPRGDCIFCYIAEDVSYASRINSDLTVFRSLDERGKITGFKIKNVQRILDENKNIALNGDPDLVVEVGSVLLATLKGHKDADVQVYGILIAAVFNQPKPPTVHVTKRATHRKEQVSAC